MILNQSQAEAVYSAIVALNNVSVNSGATVSFVDISDDGLARYTITEDAVGEIEVIYGPVPARRVVESYDSQTAFAAAYGLDHGGEDDSPASSYAGMFGTSGNTPRPES